MFRHCFSFSSPKKKKKNINKAAKRMTLSEFNWNPGKEASHTEYHSYSFCMAFVADK